MKKVFQILFVSMIALCLLPVGSIVSADGKTYDNIKDGEYDITAKAMHETEDKASAAAGYLNEEATLAVHEGQYELTIIIPENEMLDLKSLIIEGVQPTVVEKEDGVHNTYTFDNIQSELNAKTSYEVPTIGLVHNDVGLRFILQGLDDLPIVEDEVTEPEETETPGDVEKPENEQAFITNPDESREVNVISSSPAVGKQFDNPASLITKDGKTYIQMSGTGGQYIKSLTINEKEVTWGDRNEDGTYTFQFELPGKLTEELDFGMVIDTGNRVMEHSVDLAFEEISDEPEEQEIELNTSTPVSPNQTIIVEGTQVTMPSNLPENAEVVVKKSDVKKQGELEIAGEAYTFDFKNIGDYSGTFTLEMEYDAKKYGDQYEVDIYYFDESKQKWLAQNGKVKDGKITVEVNHFLTYGVFAKKVEKETPKQETEKVFEIDYVIKQANGKDLSISDDFFLKPGKIIEKNGKKYVQLTIENGDMIQALSNQYGDAKIIQKNKDGSVVVELQVNDDLSDMLLDMHIVVPSGAITGFPGYDAEHQALLVFDKDSLKGITDGSGVEPGKGSDSNYGQGETETKPNPEKPSFDDNDTTNVQSEDKLASFNTTNNPQTGDTTNVLLFSLLLIGSLIPLGIQFRRRFS